MNKQVDTIEKVYYTISEVAEMFGVRTSNIRFWESEIELLKPRRNGNGLRRYTQDDIAVIRKVVKLIYEDGFTLWGVNKQLASEHNEYCAFCGRGGTESVSSEQLSVDSKKLTVDELADKIISILENEGLTPNEMLRVIRITKQRLHFLKYKKETEVSNG